MNNLSKLLSGVALAVLVGIPASFAGQMKGGMKDGMEKSGMEMEDAAAMSTDVMDKEMKPMKKESGHMKGEAMSMETKDGMKKMPNN